MTDLRKLAEQAEKQWPSVHRESWDIYDQTPLGRFLAACSPEAVLALLDANQTLEARLGEGFPIQRGKKSNAPSTVPLWLAQRAYDVYSARYGTSQSLKRLGERGGFHEDEYDMFVPGWRELLSESSPAQSESKHHPSCCGTCDECLRVCWGYHGPERRKAERRIPDEDWNPQLPDTTRRPSPYGGFR